MDIKCRKTSCRYNDSYSCQAKSIDICRSTQCGTFQPDNTKPTLDYTRNMFEADLEYANSRHIKNVCLRCASRICLFNHGGECSANGVTILDEGKGDTACATFIKDRV